MTNRTEKAKELSLEEKLKEIIQAQVKGGCRKYAEATDMPILNALTEKFSDGDPVGLRAKAFIEHGFILEILLDTQGCKAIWKEKPHYCDGCGTAICWEENPQSWEGAMHGILDAWNSGDGNNWQEAITVAFSLLKK